MLLPRFFSGILSLHLFVLNPGIAYSQDYPNKTIRIIDGAAGGGTDFTARQIAQGISGPLGQPVIVDNRPPGVNQGETVANAPPDGYTLFVTGAVFWTYPLLRKAPYDVVKDFSPISLLERSVNVVTVHPSVPAKSIKELIALAKTRPGELNYGSSGVGGNPHLAAELFKSMADVNIVHIPYKGSAPRLSALISGEIQMTILDAGLAPPHVKSGKLRALAVTSLEPSALAPGLPTVAASGVPGYEAVGMTGMFAPAKTPVAIINRLNQEIVRVLNRADVKERFLKAGVDTIGSTPEEFANKIKSEMSTWGKVIRDAGIKAD